MAQGFCVLLRNSTCLRTCLFFSTLCTGLSQRAEHGCWSDFIDRQTTTSCDLFWAFQLTQCVDGSAHDVDRVCRAHGFRQDVVDACSLENRTDWAAGDNTGTWGCWTQQDNACSMLTLGDVWNRRANQWDAEEVLLSFFDTLGNGCWYFLRLAVADTDHAFAIADHDEGGKGETASTFDHFGDTVDRDNAFQELIAVVVTATPAATTTFTAFGALALAALAT